VLKSEAMESDQVDYEGEEFSPRPIFQSKEELLEIWRGSKVFNEEILLNRYKEDNSRRPFGDGLCDLEFSSDKTE
jgi:hypothetical protein